MSGPKKAIIPAAGLGTRFDPLSQIIPKELIPVLNKPLLQYVMEEARASGVSEIILVISSWKRPFFERIAPLFPDIKITFVEQREPKGLGHAVWVAKGVVEGENFFVLLPDVIISTREPVCTQLLKVFRDVGMSVNATERIPHRELSQYGVYDLDRGTKGRHKAKRVVEKPALSEAPGDFVVVGRYLFTPEIFPALEKTKQDKRGEIQLAAAMDFLAKQGRLYAYEFEGMHLDLGDPLRHLKGSVSLGLKEWGDSFKKFLKEIAA